MAGTRLSNLWKSSSARSSRFQDVPPLTLEMYTQSLIDETEEMPLANSTN